MEIKMLSLISLRLINFQIDIGWSDQKRCYMEDAVSLVKHVGVRLLPRKHQLRKCTLIPLQLLEFGMWEDVSDAHEF